MTENRIYHTATLLLDGTVLVAGGSGGLEKLSSAAIYHPKAILPAPVLFSVTGDRQGPGAILLVATQQLVSPAHPLWREKRSKSSVPGWLMGP
jgi:hypothetical protein